MPRVSDGLKKDEEKLVHSIQMYEGSDKGPDSQRLRRILDDRNAMSKTLEALDEGITSLRTECVNDQAIGRTEHWNLEMFIDRLMHLPSTHLARADEPTEGSI